MQEKFETLKVTELLSNVVEVKLNRPEIHNAFNEKMIEEMEQLMASLAANKELKAVVLAGEGKSFSAGADLNWMKKMVSYSEEENFRDSQKLCQMLEAMDSLPVPLLGVIHGAALGGGVGLASLCDYVIAEQETTFGLTEVKLGLLPAVISPFVIRKIGYSNARAYFLTGKRFKAVLAKELGLVHELVTGDQLNQARDSYLKEILSAGPSATRQAKELAKNVSAQLYQHDYLKSYTCGLISKARVSPEGQEGMSSLLDKRPPVWIKQ